ncbi:MAG: peptide-methionine (S)-S-oxide reductase MsrA [Saprospiraceae bacterium]
MKIKEPKLEITTLGAGCFWCVEAVFQRLQGVEKIESGYSGGHVENPTYKEICGKKTGHAEVAQIYFNPEIISFEEILEVFWYTHDPTTIDQQGNDKGPQYRSEIFYHNEKQKSTAEISKADVAILMWHDPIVTKISPLINYYPAERYHQDYFNLNPTAGYCQFVVNPKVQKFKAKYAKRLKEVK